MWLAHDEHCQTLNNAGIETHAALLHARRKEQAGPFKRHRLPQPCQGLAGSMERFQKLKKHQISSHVFFNYCSLEPRSLCMCNYLDWKLLNVPVLLFPVAESREGIIWSGGHEKKSNFLPFFFLQTFFLQT